MKLGESVLCMDCEEMFVPQDTGQHCPACGSAAYAPVARWVPTMESYERGIVTIQPVQTTCNPERRRARALNL